MVRKKIITAAALFALAGAATLAQQKDPVSTTSAFTTEGINVIVSPSDNELVSVIIGMEGGVASGESQNPALADFTSDLIVTSGSKSYPKEQLRKFLSQTSTQISGGADYRGINLSMTATRPNFDKAWEVLSSLALEPLYDSVAFRNIRQRMITAVKGRWSQAEAFSQNIADSLVKLGNPVLGRWVSMADVEQVSIPAIMDFHNRLKERSRLFIVVVGKVTPDEIKAKLRSFSKLPTGRYKAVSIPALTVPAAPQLVTIDRKETPTTYVTAAFTGPDANDRDYWSLVVGMNHLRSMLFEEIRTKRNLSYAPQSWASSLLGRGIGRLSVSSVLPDSAIAVMYRELEKMKRGEFKEEDLNNSKQVFITSFYMARTTNGSKATALFSSQRNAGDWRLAFAYDQINAVTKETVQRAFRNHASNLQVGVVGNQAGVTRDRYLFSK